MLALAITVPRVPLGPSGIIPQVETEGPLVLDPLALALVLTDEGLLMTRGGPLLG